MPLPNEDINISGDLLKGMFAHLRNEELQKNSPAEVSKDIMYDALKSRSTVIEEFAIRKSDFDNYQEFVKSMKVYPEKNAIIYPTLGIAGEGGEIAEKVKKWLRGDRELDKLELLKEAGDVMWYLTSLVDDLGYTLDDMIMENMKKLKSRKERGVQKGDGDNR